ncbi:hypothetical protein OIO90_002467 [Microbotryomycetes sp. JL221]|nr:hypothetical protein OIO90_002467 [Microbotryomycetes sp. JL221]
MLVILPGLTLVLFAWASQARAEFETRPSSSATRRATTAGVKTVQLSRRSTPLDVSLARTRGKYGFSRATLSSNRRRAVGDIALTEDASDLSYAASATIGGQQLELVLDTGSSDLVVATHECTDCEGSVYDPNSSSTASVSSTPFDIQYGSGSASGILVSDTVTLGTFSIASQTFGACADFESLLGGSESGLLGLGWQSLAMSGAVPFAQHLWQEGGLTEPMFGLALRSGDGTLTLGGVDLDAISEDINWISMEDTDSYWSIPLDGVQVNGVDVGISTESAIIDSGTSLMSMPASAVQSIYAAISSEAYESSGLMVYPCAANATVSLSFGGVWYSVPSDGFSYGNADSSGEECWGSVYDASEGTSDLFIIGGAFLQHVYSAFRFDPPSIGFANLAGVDSGSAVAASEETSSPSFVLPDVASTVPLVAPPTSSATDSSSAVESTVSTESSASPTDSSTASSTAATVTSAAPSVLSQLSSSTSSSTALNAPTQAAASAVASDLPSSAGSLHITGTRVMLAALLPHPGVQNYKRA